MWILVKSRGERYRYSFMELMSVLNIRHSVSHELERCRQRKNQVHGCGDIGSILIELDHWIQVPKIDLIRSKC